MDGIEERDARSTLWPLACTMVEKLIPRLWGTLDLMMNLLPYTHISLLLIPIDLVSFANNSEFVESELPSQ